MKKTPLFFISIIAAMLLVHGIAYAEDDKTESITKADYIKRFIQLNNVRVGQGYGEYDVPGISNTKRSVFGTIKNTGNKTIKMLDITIYFLDKSKRRIGEKEAGVVNAYSLFDKSGPLKPNYVRDFGVIVGDATPANWNGKVEIEVKRIDGEGLVDAPKPVQNSNVNPAASYIPLIIIFGLPIWYMIAKRRNPKAKGPRMVKETKCTCQACGNTWYYGKSEYLENLGQKMINSANRGSNLSNDLLCCAGCWPAAFLPKHQEIPVKDLNKCPKCNSTAIKKEEIVHQIS